LLGTGLVAEYAMCTQAFGWPEEVVHGLARTSIAASFANDDVKASLNEALSRWSGAVAGT
jgi:adenosine deaminase